MKSQHSMIYPERISLPCIGQMDQSQNNLDLIRLACTMSHLEQAGWYWGSMTATEAKQLLHEASEGTFLMRDSSSPDCLLTLSVKTSVGPTHIRIQYDEGKFGFDSALLAKPKLKHFEYVVGLVQFYALVCQNLNNNPQMERSVSKAPSIQLKLTKPLYTCIPSLQHLCRIVINKRTRSVRELPLAPGLKEYLLKYPFLM
ncbi:suppressor of cytokine signaling 2-like [Protopterus annectens]|uniref:suppressor of cytokine signaling 2-like n=1 Tax=Protopterus annectens TaxID=7888 RepID=UPI001CFA1067|nr:suppressor of cytokine signaling 2-like [Protopterus annectens]